MECQVAPRTLESLRARPASLVPIEPAPPEVAAGVADTMRELLACINAGDIQRQYALYSDRWLGLIGLPLDDLSLPSEPRRRSERAAFLAFYYVHLFPDGRAGAVVVIDDPKAVSPVEAFYVVFSQTRDGWRLDDIPSESLPPILLATPAAGTPAPSTLTRQWGAEVPSPEECRVTPRAFEEVEELVRAEPTPGGPPPFLPDEAADPRTVEQIRATAREMTACINAGDLLRLYALWSDELIRVQAPDLAVVARAAEPRPEDQRSAFIGVYAVRRFADGRVGAAVVINDPRRPGPVETQYVLFSQERGRWVQDAVLTPYIFEVEEVE